MNLKSSQNCPYQENQENPTESCGCSQNCGPNDICLPWHHKEFAGISKKAFFGIIAPQNIARKLKDELIQRNYPEKRGIYTLFLNQFSSDFSDNTTQINIEIELFKSLHEIDPEGEFTPQMFYHTVIRKNSHDMAIMHKMRRNLQVFHDKAYIKNALDQNALDTTTKKLTKQDFENGKSFIELIYSCIGDLTLIFVSDAGKSLTTLCQEISLKQTVVSSKDVIDCTRKLPENYAKLAAQDIGHFDMHCQNICYKMKKNKPCLSIIDFGFNSYMEYGQLSNFIHFLLAEIDFNYLENSSFMRSCDPVHYHFFIACFEMMIQYFSQYCQNGIGNINNLTLIFLKMAQHLFSIEASDDDALAPARIIDIDSRIIEAKYFQFRAKVKNVYSRFLNPEQLNKIWRRVCLKTYSAVMRYHYAHDEFITTIARTYNPNEKTFSSNKYNKKRTADGKFKHNYPCVSYLPILDDFSMAYYDYEEEQYDYNFLKRKFDEFSVIHACIFFLSSVYIVDDDTTPEIHQGKIDIMHEIDRLKMKFEPPNTNYSDGSIEFSFINFKHSKPVDNIPQHPPLPSDQSSQSSSENDLESLSSHTETYHEINQQDSFELNYSINSLNFSDISP